MTVKDKQNKRNFEESKNYNLNPLDTLDDEEDTVYEGGDDTTKIKPRRQKMRKKKGSGSKKDVTPEITQCCKIMTKASQITQEYQKIF